MSILDYKTEQWIQHEVKLRTHEGNFKSIQKTLDKLERKIDTMYQLVISAIIIPIFLFIINLLIVGNYNNKLVEITSIEPQSINQVLKK